MPTSYAYKCGSCSLEVEREAPMGEAPKIVRCPDCQGTAVQVLGRGLRIGAGALPTKRAGVIRDLDKESALSADMGAYKRMRERGIQPKQIDGASVVEDHVADTFDCEYGKFYGRAKTRDEARERIRSGLNEASELAEESGNAWLKKNAEPVA